VNPISTIKKIFLIKEKIVDIGLKEWFFPKKAKISIFCVDEMTTNVILLI
jgi:hypothetical protein